METEIIIAVVLGACLQLAVFIAIFVITGNIVKIRKSMYRMPDKDLITQTGEELGVGNLEKAKDYLLRRKYRLEKWLESIAALEAGDKARTKAKEEIEGIEVRVQAIEKLMI